MAPMGLRDREAGTITVTSSLGLPKKIARMRENPSVAIAYHAREHGFSDRPEYVVVQGTASVPEHPDRPWLESITPEWERFLGPRHGQWLGRGPKIYYWERLGIPITVRRVLVYDGHNPVKVIGEPLPDDPAPQVAPKKGTGPRSRPRRRRGASTGCHTHCSVGSEATACRWSAVSPATARTSAAYAWLPATPRRLRVAAAPDSPATCSSATWSARSSASTPGGSRSTGAKTVYAPHTKAGYAVPASRGLMTVGTALTFPKGYREARELGLVTASEATGP